MAEIIKRPFRTFNGTEWEDHYFKTSEDQVVPQEATVFPFPFNSESMVHDGKSTYSKKNGIVNVTMNTKRSNSNYPEYPTGWWEIGTLPVGFRPKDTVDGYMMTYPEKEVTAIRVIASTGQVYGFVKSASQTYMFGSISFYAGGGTV